MDVSGRQTRRCNTDVYRDCFHLPRCIFSLVHSSRPLYSSSPNRLFCLALLSGHLWPECAFQPGPPESPPERGSPKCAPLYCVLGMLLAIPVYCSVLMLPLILASVAEVDRQRFLHVQRTPLSCRCGLQQKAYCACACSPKPTAWLPRNDSYLWPELLSTSHQKVYPEWSALWLVGWIWKT